MTWTSKTTIWVSWTDSWDIDGTVSYPTLLIATINMSQVTAPISLLPLKAAVVFVINTTLSVD